MWGILTVCHALHKTEAEVRQLPVDELFRHLVYLKASDNGTQR